MTCINKGFAGSIDYRKKKINGRSQTEYYGTAKWKVLCDLVPHIKKMDFDI
jgi:hypothetical protein